MHRYPSGKGTIGIEVPNSNPKIVSGQSIIGSKKFQESTYDLPVALGKTITNEVFMVDLCKMPHMLVAGATGQGKSVGLNAIITSLLYKKHPAELKFVLVDPKKVEFSIYSVIEHHFLAKLPDGEDAIITDVTKVVQTLNSICVEMDTRYDLLKAAHVRNIKEYNEKFINRQLNPEKGHKFMPYIVVVIDEFGDLIMTAGKEVELPIARIAQLARAVGIHMIIATQRPTTNIITGTIKANFPARVAFRVSAMIDSRTILDRPGANQLIGRGDMLFLQGADPVRVQCAFIDMENGNSYSKTDPDATFMRMKEDAMKNGQTKPGYNLQIGTENQFIIDFRLFPNPTDTLTLIPFFHSFQHRYNRLPGIGVADSGYGSEENYRFMQENGIEAFVKYNYFHKEQRPRYTPNPFHAESLHYNAGEDYYVCPMGQHMNRIGTRRDKTASGYITESARYKAQRCEGCPLHGSCFKAQGNRIIEVNHRLNQYKRQARERLVSEEGVRHRGRRCIEPEAVFGQMKYNNT